MLTRVCALVVISLTTSAPWNTRSASITRTFLAANYDDANDFGSKDTFNLPIFPLRKSVRFPTESIQLNLYETRYLRLAEHVLRNPVRDSPDGKARCLFGALYSSDKAQVVKGNGLGPAVPIISKDDIGTIFEVTKHEEGMIPTRGGDLRRRIRLEAIGIGRFRIERIVSAGFALDNNANDDNDTLYTVAGVSAFKDERVSFEEYKQLQDCLETLSEEVCLDATTIQGTKKRHGGRLGEEQEEDQQISLATRCDLESEPETDLNQLSFSVASNIMERSASLERARVLKMTSLREELFKALRRGSKPWWKWLS